MWLSEMQSKELCMPKGGEEVDTNLLISVEVGAIFCTGGGL
jgi:hypothetical protein